MDNLCNIIYNLCNVRGFETIVKFLPHEVEDLELLVDLLQNLDVAPYQWYIKYVLYQWLSIVVLVPFDLDTIDTKKDGDVTLLQKLVNECESSISAAGPNREAASIVLGKLLTRLDVVRMGYLDSFLKTIKEKFIFHIDDSA